jgi:hypothetical protein
VSQEAGAKAPEDTVMREEGAEKNQDRLASNAEGGVKPSDTAAQAEKEANSNPISQGQLLWVKGAAKADQEMVAEDDEQEDQSSECHEHIDPELKKKCLQAQDLDKLFTLNINTYKVCQLNTILSTLGLRLEPKE